MRCKTSIAVACTLVICTASLLWWEHRHKSIKYVTALRSRAEQGDSRHSSVWVPRSTTERVLHKITVKHFSGMKELPTRMSHEQRTRWDICALMASQSRKTLLRRWSGTEDLLNMAVQKGSLI